MRIDSSPNPFCRDNRPFNRSRPIPLNFLRKNMLHSFRDSLRFIAFKPFARFRWVFGPIQNKNIRTPLYWILPWQPINTRFDFTIKDGPQSMYG
jgi:hypothetical protein